MKVGMIGAGNMAEAIWGGMLHSGFCKPEDILVSRRSETALEKIQSQYGIRTTTDNVQVAKECDLLFLAVKPQFLNTVITEIKEVIREEQILISIAAGKTIEWLEAAFAKPIKLIRTMPNTPALVGEGCTGICANEQVSEEEKELALQIFSSVGKAFFIEERLMDTVGALSGSSPAYVFMMIEAMADGAVAGGLPRAQAIEMAAQTFLGSAKLLLESGKHPGQLKDMVCSPGGTTIRGLQVLEERALRGAIIDALQACIEQSKKL